MSRSANSLPAPCTRQFIWPILQAIIFCASLPSPEAEEALKAADANHGVHPSVAGDHYLWSMATQSAAGGRYFFLLSRPRTAELRSGCAICCILPPLNFRSELVLFGATTFIMVLLLVRPIGRLRSAARQLANGELGTRVPEPDGEERLFGGDEIQGLVHDFNHMAEQLEQLVGAQKMLVRDVSHELRSPLARLSVALELAREEAPEVMTEHLQTHRARGWTSESVDRPVASFVLHGIDQCLDPHGIIPPAEPD